VLYSFVRYFLLTAVLLPHSRPRKFSSRSFCFVLKLRLREIRNPRSLEWVEVVARAGT
jgi:hypothetical protein